MLLNFGYDRNKLFIVVLRNELYNVTTSIINKNTTWAISLLHCLLKGGAIVAVYLISYDLKTPGKDYQDLYDAIKSCGAWRHYLDSTWLLTTYKPAKDIFEILQPHLDTSDHILIVRLASESCGWLPREAWDWITAQEY